MAVIWSRERAGVRYEVRATGGTRRLYTDGVFHSSYNPARPLTGGVWDLLMLPAFFRPPNAVRRVLLLGVGGGTAIRQLRTFVQPREIVAVDLNPDHLYVARRFFGVQGRDVRLIQADARDWLARDRGRYDLVIDDLFGGAGGEPERAIAADADWCGKLAAKVGADGALAINCISPAELGRVGLLEDAALREQFPARFQLRAERDRNAVGIFLRHPAESGELRRNLLAVPELAPRRTQGVQFTLRALA